MRPLYIPVMDNRQPLLDFDTYFEAQLLNLRDANVRHLFSSRRSAAQGRGIKWSLSLEAFTRLIGQRCYACGRPPTASYARWMGSDEDGRDYEAAPLRYNGLDRLVNSRGYRVDNVAPCCKQCNFAKGTMSVRQFFAMARRIVDNLKEWYGCETQVLVEVGRPTVVYQPPAES